MADTTNSGADTYEVATNHGPHGRILTLGAGTSSGRGIRLLSGTRHLEAGLPAVARVIGSALVPSRTGAGRAWWHRRTGGA